MLTEPSITAFGGIADTILDTIPVSRIVEDAEMILGYESHAIGGYLNWRKRLVSRREDCDRHIVHRYAEACLTVFGETHPHTKTMADASERLAKETRVISEVLILVERLLNMSRTKIAESALLARLEFHNCGENPDSWPPTMLPEVRQEAARWWTQANG